MCAPVFVVLVRKSESGGVNSEVWSVACLEDLGRSEFGCVQELTTRFYFVRDSWLILFNIILHTIQPVD
jgi:hypothetical protein